MKQVNIKLVGDFYEVYGDDAKVVSKALNFVLTNRPINGVRTPLCGIPFFSSAGYIAELEGMGIKVHTRRHQPHEATQA